MASFLSALLVEVWSFTAPLRRAVASAEQLSEFFRRFGYQLPLGSQGDVAALKQALTDLTDELNGLPNIGQMNQQEAALVGTKASEVFGQIGRLQSSGGNVGALNIGADFLAEVFDVALYDYIYDRAPALLQILLAIEAVVLEDVPASSAEGRDLDYVRIWFDWARLGQFLRDSDTWAAEVYGWGVDFKYNKAMVRLANVIQAIGLPAHAEEISGTRLGLFLKNIPARNVPGVGNVHDLVQVKLPVFEAASPPDPQGNVAITAEAGVVVLPYGDFARKDQMGMALAPFIAGAATGEKPITPQLKLTVKADAQATGGAFIVFRPSGVEIAGGVAANASFELGFRYANQDGSEILLIGESGKTRLATDAAVLTLGGNLDGDLFAALGAQDLKLVIDLSGDGLLGSLVSGPITINAGNILVGWRPKRGVYFEGGTSIGLTIPLDLDLGPINIAELTVTVDWADFLKIALAVTGDLTIGPMYAYVEGIGLETTLVPADNGVLGRYDLDFAFKPPTGYAIAIAAGAVSGGGMLSMLEDEYRGALALKFQTFGISAFGILNTKPPGGGFSFVAAVFGEFSVALGAGFFLTGVGGAIGLNRTVDTDALRQVIYDGRFDLQLFPPDPIANARTILADMAAIYRMMTGQHFAGPIARIAWGKPTLVEGKVGLIVEVGGFTRILILGNVGAKLPTKESSLIVLQVSFFGEIDFAAGTISFDASLAGSRILDFPISGEAAVRTGWASRLDHVASFGGLHPRYPRPSSLPDLQRLSINFGSNNPRVTLTSYAAMTLNSVQFGARAELYAKGPKVPLVGRLAAEGQVYFDALIYFNPFRFEAALGGGLTLLVDGDAVLGLGFDLLLSGPNPFHINGNVWATVCHIDVEFPITYTWGSSRSVPAETADPVAILKTALANSVFEPLPVSGRVESVVFAQDKDAAAAIDPYNGARFVQKALPLAVAIERVGEAQIAGSARRFDVRVYEPTGAAVAVNNAMQDFVLGHFWGQGEGQRLSAPAFGEHKGGFDLDSSGLTAPMASAIQTQYSYETIEIPVVDDRDAPGAIGAQPMDVPRAFTKRWMRAYHREIAEPFERYAIVRPAQDGPSVRKAAYVTPRVQRAAAVAATADDALIELRRGATSFAEARQTYFSGAGRKRDTVNPIVADYVAAAG